MCLPLSPTLNEQRIYCETFSSFGSLFFLLNLLQCLIAVESGDMHFACVCPAATRRQRIKKKNKKKKTEKLWYFEKASARDGGASEPALFLMEVRGLSGPLFDSVLYLFGLAAELLARRNAAGDEGFGEGPFEGWG